MCAAPTRARLSTFVKREAPGVKISETPMMRGRFVTIGDRPVEKVKPSDNVAWALEGDRGVTFADKPPEGSEVVAGTWWPSDYSGPPLVSMEKEVAEGLGLHVGDTVVVNVLGRDIAAKLANLRKVNWRSFAINFVLVYSPNALKGAPYTELVSASLPSAAPDAELKLMRAVAQAVPERRQRPGARSHGQCRNAGRQACARHPRGDGGGAHDLGPGARRRARGQSARAPRRRDDPEDPWRDAQPPHDDVPDRIRAFGSWRRPHSASRRERSPPTWVVWRIMQFDFVFDWRAALAAAGGGLAITVGLGMIGAWRTLSQKPAAYLREL